MSKRTRLIETHKGVKIYLVYDPWTMKSRYRVTRSDAKRYFQTLETAKKYIDTYKE